MRMPWFVLALATACSGSSSPKSPAPEVGRAEKLQIGNLEAFALADGSLTFPNDAKTFGVGHPPAEIGDVLAGAKLSRDQLHLDMQALLVKAGDRVILFDTGIGNAKDVDGGRLPLSLALAGVEPVAVTDIFISHAHGDHVSGLVRGGALAFPAATIHFSTAEWASLQADADPEAKAIVAAIAPKVVPFEPGAQVLPVVKAVDTHGHTPGHSSYEVGAPDGEKLFYLGDVAHHSIISVQRPAWSIQFDQDRPTAEAVRQQTLAKLAADHTRVFAFHFPFPGVGHVVTQGDGLAWQPER